MLTILKDECPKTAKICVEGDLSKFLSYQLSIRLKQLKTKCCRKLR